MREREREADEDLNGSQKKKGFWSLIKVGGFGSIILKDGCFLKNGKIKEFIYFILFTGIFYLLQ